MSSSPLNIGMIGCGTVGGGVARLLRENAELYEQRAGRPLDLKRVLVRDKAKAAASGDVDPALVTDDADVFFEDTDLDVIVEVAGGLEPIHEYIQRALASGMHVVTANKSLLAAHANELFQLARQHKVALAFEASCAGGIPVVTALKFGLMANQIQGLYGILNGTCNLILTAMIREGRAYDDALEQAKELGYAEADPTLDVSGQDAAQKLAILASLAFDVEVHESDVHTAGVDALEVVDVQLGRELGYDIKLLAIAEQKPGEDRISLGVEPCFVHDDELLAKVEGAYNALSVYGHAVGHTLYYGAGAGRMPTASAVVSDLLNVAGGWYPHAFAHVPPANGNTARLVQRDELVSRFYVRINAIDAPGTMAKVTRILGDAGISLSAVLQHESAAGQLVPFVILTHDAHLGDLQSAARKIGELDVIHDEPVLIRIVDMPRGD